MLLLWRRGSDISADRAECAGPGHKETLPRRLPRRCRDVESAKVTYVLKLSIEPYNIHIYIYTYIFVYIYIHISICLYIKTLRFLRYYLYMNICGIMCHEVVDGLGSSVEKWNFIYMERYIIVSSFRN